MVEHRMPASNGRMMIDHSEVPHGEYNRGRLLWIQWGALLLAPAAFFAHLQLGYSMVQWACNNDQTLWIHLAGALSVLLGAVGTYLGWWLWSHARRVKPGETSDLPARARFLGVSGFATSAVLTLVLATQWAAVFVYSPCQ